MQSGEKSDELREIIRKIAAQNAFKHEGKADPSSVMGKLLSLKPELRPSVKEIMPIVSEICSEVSSITLGKLNEIYVKEDKKKQEELGLPDLPGAVQEKVVTRFAPNPNSALHLGSSRAAILSHDYAKKYSGKFIVRFEDTDPRLKRSDKKFYSMVKEDLRWLGCEWDEMYIQSERMEIYYKWAEEAIKIGLAYVTECDSQSFKDLVLRSVPCPDRELSPKEHLERWYKMLNGEYKEGQAVVRIKTNLDHPNPAVRDWPALRIIDPETHSHPIAGKKYRIWPLYNWASAVDDHLMNITHIIRGQEHFVNMIRQSYVYQAFGWVYPQAVHYGKLVIEGSSLSKSDIEMGIKGGKFFGYDDPRLGTLAALRRRGIEPEAIRKMIHEMGINPNTATVSLDILYALNRKIIDRVSNRYFGVFGELHKLKLKGVPDQFTVSLPRHPDDPDRPRRIITVNAGGIIIEERDFSGNSDKEVRLIGLGNFRLFDEDAQFVNNDLNYAKGLPHIQWVTENESIGITVLMDDATELMGKSESNITYESKGSHVQFERRFFAKIEEIKPENVYAVYTSR
ncbi:MAG: glutamate--tRNA ligase [Conexivisphaerales archaeon]